MVVLEAGAVVAGKYRLERALARGSMGSVWAASHLQLRTQVAVKFMDPSYAGSVDVREAKASARLQSPHVVQVHDYGVAEGSPFLVMDLLQGEDLGARLDREKRLSLTAASRIVAQICKTVRSAHEAGLVHRNLKPANIFLSRHHDDEIVKVLDFGFAKATLPGTPATRTGALIGSPQFMSPEQARTRKDIDHRSDLWSLGVIAFRCITGELPFAGRTLDEVIAAICDGPIPVPSEILPDLGPEVDFFFASALVRDPARRFAGARVLGEALGELATLLEGAPSVRGSFAEISAPGSAGNPAAIAASALAAAAREAPVEHGLGTEVLAPGPLPRAAVALPDSDPQRVVARTTLKLDDALPLPLPSAPPALLGSDATRRSVGGTMKMDVPLILPESPAVAAPPAAARPRVARPIPRRRGWMIAVSIGAGVMIAGLAILLLHAPAAPPSVKVQEVQRAEPVERAPVSAAATPTPAMAPPPTRKACPPAAPAAADASVWAPLVQPARCWRLTRRAQGASDPADALLVETTAVHRVGEADVADLRYTHVKDGKALEDALGDFFPRRIAVTRAGAYVFEQENDEAIEKALKVPPPYAVVVRPMEPAAWNGQRFLRKLKAEKGSVVCIGRRVPGREGGTLCLTADGVVALEGPGSPPAFVYGQDGYAVVRPK